MLTVAKAFQLYDCKKNLLFVCQGAHLVALGLFSMMLPVMTVKIVVTVKTFIMIVIIIVVILNIMMQAGEAVMARLHCLVVTALFKAALQQQPQPGMIHAALHAAVHLCKLVHAASPCITVQDLKPN